MFVRFDYSAGYCGTDNYEFGKFEDTTTAEELNEIGLQIVQQYCESFGIDIEQEEEESGVEWEYDYTWNVVKEDEVEENICTDYTKH